MQSQRITFSHVSRGFHVTFPGASSSFASFRALPYASSDGPYFAMNSFRGRSCFERCLIS